MEHVVVVGAGFAGLRVAQALADKPVEVTVVDRHNYHLFQPLLYQVATAGLDAHDIAPTMRGIVRDAPNIDFRMAAATGIDLERRLLLVDDGEPLAFDHLVLAAGATTDTLGIPGVREHTYPMKTLDDAVRIRDHVLHQFELAAADPDRLDDPGWLTFVVAGGGPTGVEMCGAFVELIDDVLARDYRHRYVDRARVVLVEALPNVLNGFSDASQDFALRALEERGVEVLVDAPLEEVRPDAVDIGGDDRRTIATRTVIWAAGVRTQPLADALGFDQTGGGRIVVDPDLSVPGHRDIWVVGDMAGATDAEGDLYPQLAPVAQQQGMHVARQIALCRRSLPTAPFRYEDKGIMATVGRSAAVVDLPFGIHLDGRLAWLVWLFAHLLFLVGFRNRASVLVDWGYNYLTFDRAARTIVRTDGGPRRTPGEDHQSEVA